MNYNNKHFLDLHCQNGAVMNIYILISSIISLLAVIGHFAIGRRIYMKPVLDSEIDPIPKKVMQSVFHYMSFFQVFSTLVLFMTSLNSCMLFNSSHMVVRFIGITYLGFALAQLIVAITSGIPGGIFKIFQWVFWLLVGIFALIGVFI